jgi:hypothetical protein
MGPSPAVEIERNQTFRFWAWPGPNGIVARVHNPGLYIKAIRLGGVDVTDEPVRISDGIDVEGVEVEITDVFQTLSGKVAARSDSDELIEDLAVIVFPVDRDLWTSGRRTALARVGKNGEFIVSALPPGTYAAAVLPFNDGLSLRDPRLLESLQDKAQTVSLPEGGTASVVLRR